MPGRRLGQHFLTSPSILERIAEAASPSTASTIVEIGPGKGALTQYLLSRTPRLVAIEIDQVLVHYLQQKFRDAENLAIINNDVLKTDLAQWGPVAVTGNLPYYITSPIVERVLSLGPLLQRAVFLVQREVAERMSAVPGTRDYGYLSVQVQLLAEPKILFHVAPGAFRPPPKVESSVIRLERRTEPLIDDIQGFLAFTSACFRQKRKTLRNNLLGHYEKPVIEALPEGGKRAEQLSIPDLISIYRRIGLTGSARVR